MTPSEAAAKAHQWHGEAGGELLPPLTANELAGIVNEALSAMASQRTTITWPKSRDVGRIGDMSADAHLRIGLDSENDVYASIWDEKGGASIEFCCPGAGGGKSSRTRIAMIALMVAMEADNAEDQSRDWWARRSGAMPQAAN